MQQVVLLGTQAYSSGSQLEEKLCVLEKHALQCLSSAALGRHAMRAMQNWLTSHSRLAKAGKISSGGAAQRFNSLVRQLRLQNVVGLADLSKISVSPSRAVLAQDEDKQSESDDDCCSVCYSRTNVGSLASCDHLVCIG